LSSFNLFKCISLKFDSEFKKENIKGKSNFD